MTRSVLPLTGTQLLRLMYRSFRTTEALNQIQSARDLQYAQWLGDKHIPIYLALMEELFEDMQMSWNLRQQYYEMHMRESKDHDIMNDLSTYHRSPQVDGGKSHNYVFLRNSLMRKKARMQQDEQLNLYLTQGTNFQALMTKFGKGGGKGGKKGAARSSAALAAIGSFGDLALPAAGGGANPGIITKEEAQKVFNAVKARKDSTGRNPCMMRAIHGRCDDANCRYSNEKTLPANWFLH